MYASSNFNRATGKRRIGEASTTYLASRSAPKEILDFNPSAQIIVMVRSPIDVIHSMHSQKLFNGAEHITRFELAVDSQETRYWRAGPFRGEPVLRPHYREITRFSEQIQRYFDAFGKERVHVIVYDDFAKAPGIAYENVLSFLGLRSYKRSNFAIINKNKRVRFPALQDWLMYPYKLLRPIGYVSPALWREIRDIARRLNYVYEPRSAIEAGFRQRLAIEYAPEVRNLEMLLGVNLDHWLACPSPVVSNPEGALLQFQLGWPTGW